MNDPEARLARWLADARDGTLNEDDRRELNAALREDPDVLDRTATHLEVEGLLLWHHGRAALAVDPPAPRRALRSVPWAWVAVAATVLLAVSLALHLGADRDEAADVAIAGWTFTPTGDARFEAIGPHRIRIEDGELLVASTTSPAPPLTIVTPNAEATASGTSFYVGHHRTARPTPAMQRQLTRVLVLTGTVALSNAHGSVTATEGDFVAAADERAPVAIAADANNEFGFALLRELAERSAGGNVVFSPFSLHTALGMAAEGARGATAREMYEVLGLPPEAWRLGEDGQALPLAVALRRSGFAQLHDRIHSLGVADQSELEEQIRDARARLADLRTRVREAADASEWSVYADLRPREEAAVERVNDLEARLKTYRIRVANALWGERSYPFASSYLHRIQDVFGLDAFVPANFRGDAPGEVRRINRWVAHVTEGLIPELVNDQVVRADTELVLLNAMHFAGDWVEAFDPGETRREPFTRRDGTVVDVDMMRQDDLEKARFGAFHRNGVPLIVPAKMDAGADPPTDPGPGGVHVLELPYRGEDLAFLVVVPRDVDGLSEVRDRLTAKRLKSWRDGLEPRSVNVHLPRLDLESGQDVAEALVELGMARAFTAPNAPDGADFSGICEGDDGTQALYLNTAIHKARISVDEAGTVAAAATALSMVRGVRQDRIPVVPEVVADRPFLFAVIEQATGTVLFLGEVDDPR